MTDQRPITEYVFEKVGMPMTRRPHPTIAYINKLGSTWGAHRPNCRLVDRIAVPGSEGTKLRPDRIGKRIEQAVCHTCGWVGAAGTGADVYPSLIEHAEETLLAIQLANPPAISVPVDKRDTEEQMPNADDGTGQAMVLVGQPELERSGTDSDRMADGEVNRQAADEIMDALRDIQSRLAHLEKDIRPKRRRVRRRRRTH